MARRSRGLWGTTYNVDMRFGELPTYTAMVKIMRRYGFNAAVRALIAACLQTYDKTGDTVWWERANTLNSTRVLKLNHLSSETGSHGAETRTKAVEPEE